MTQFSAISCSMINDTVLRCRPESRARSPWSGLATADQAEEHDAMMSRSTSLEATLKIPQIDSAAWSFRSLVMLAAPGAARRLAWRDPPAKLSANSRRTSRSIRSGGRGCRFGSIRDRRSKGSRR